MPEYAEIAKAHGKAWYDNASDREDDHVDFLLSVYEAIILFDIVLVLGPTFLKRRIRGFISC